MRGVLADVAARSAPLEYWFLKLHAGPLAFLVDFIVRRPAGGAEVRVSLWVDGHGQVARTRAAAWHASGSGVAVGADRFGAERSVGAVDGVEWDLAYEAGDARV